MITVVLFSLPAMAQEPTHCAAIHFAPSRSAGTVSGSVGSDEPRPCYTFITRTKQTVVMKFIKTNGNMAFSIYGLVDDRDNYSFKTTNKNYKFVVFQNLRAPPAPFSLMVAVR